MQLLKLEESKAHTARKLTKYEVFSGPRFPVFGPGIWKGEGWESLQIHRF